MPAIAFWFSGSSFSFHLQVAVAQKEYDILHFFFKLNGYYLFQIEWLRFKVDVFNGVYKVNVNTFFKILNNIKLYILLNT
jgi:hypothetical protein